MSLKLYGYWRSSATYRVRIAMNLKGLDYEYVPVHLVKEGGEQTHEVFKRLNPAQLVPALVDDDEDFVLNQSLSIIEYLDEKYPDTCRLIPEHALERARVRGLAHDIAMEMQPLGNLRVLNALRDDFNADDEDIAAWVRKWSEKGFQAIERRLQTQAGKYCFDFNVTMADVCLVPQVYIAKRFKLDMTPFPLISKIVDNCLALDAFEKARPENQPDCPE
ncbi:maleylacetoacetate isomerase [Alteromonas sp. RKMC-009]|uniref:maleylacetoacetate isomerase n=1 Tax=Alteromonas sp. RKMC-009 TaxID=2267264 RepID=UPI000C4747E5|nr:maleylacetoacetate isomerase [Alteromonas sp. RKMC-009]AYA63757.1 maleylacetoacetate isomerase [Alteromonas sp. RKMC-009]MBT80862.1 maleylacetoacetate isomerase [Alteromonadaceae bacterium]MEC7691745.1 maleylacetoacetate isomerase [Pseudomonadota bacterium]